MTIEDARDLTEGATLSADVCIVGAGAAGITIALRLIDSGLSVIMLESGGLEFEDATAELAQGTINGNLREELDGHRRRIFGGTTSIWNGWCMPLSPYDFERRDWIQYSG